ncbi:MAG: hypothetical protein ACRC46_00295 [Thermoguttaceae bacterium]
MTDPQRNFKDLGEGTLRRIDWQELVPAVFLFRAWHAAMGVRVMAISLIGVVAMLALLGAISDTGALEGVGLVDTIYEPSTTVDADCESALDQPEKIMSPVVLFTDAGYRLWCNPFSSEAAAWFFGLFLIWSLCGGAVARIAAVKLTRGGNESLRNVAAFGVRRLRSFCGAVLLVVIGMFLCYLPVYVVSICLDVPVLQFVAAGGFFIAIISGIVMALLTFLLVTAWNLMFAAVVVDGADMFDAVSRAASYLYQRIFHYAFYVICAAVLGAIGMLLISLITNGAANVAMRGCAPSLLTPDGFGSASEAKAICTQIASMWVMGLNLLPLAFSFSYFWTASVAIYILLRRSLDGTPRDHVVGSDATTARPLSLLPRKEMATESAAQQPQSEHEA